MSSSPRAYKGMAKLIVYAGNGKPNPKMGQALGPLGLNMMQFCKDFNEKTSHFRPDFPMRVILTAYTDRTYTYMIKPPPTTWFLKRIAMLQIGTNLARRRYVGQVGVKYVYEIAKLKKQLDPHMKLHNIYGICKMIIATAENMGYQVVNDVAQPIPSIPKRI